MTREEVIEELKRDIHNAKVTHHLSEHYEMAIKALEQEPKFIAKSDGTIEQIKNCNNCKYGYLSSICQKPNTEICGNSFSQWKSYKAESEE